GVVHSATRPTSASVVVLDLSGSIGPEASATIVRTLRAVAAQGGHAGLVLFSDATQEAVPPTAPAGTLRAYVRFFARANGSGLPHNPWTDSFSAGTQIGRGLAAARLALRRAGIEHGRVILVSDVNDAVLDVPLMRRELLTYARDPNIALRLAAVPGNDASAVALFRRVLGRDALAVGRPPASALVPQSRGFPTTAVLIVAAIALLLAAYELTNAPLAWREPA
ncbi:MAG: hypothetical protein ACJ77E_20985, partial [Gaiellaceae bacterium]